MANLTLPSEQEPVIDPKTGKITPRWYQFLRALVNVINAGL